MPTTRSKATRTAAAALALVAVVAAAAGDRGATAGSAPSGPVATASTRDLVTTLETTGVLERDEQLTISYARALAPAPAAPTGGAPTAPVAVPVAVTEPPPATPPAVTEPLPATPPAVTEPPPATPPAVTEPVADATAPAGPGPCTATDAGTPSTACPPDDPAPTTTTTVAPPLTANTTAPAASPAPAIPSRPAPGAAAVTPAASAPRGQAGAGPTLTGPAVVAEEDPAILTAIAALGSEVERGTVLYAADDEPVVALVGPVPAWRTLEAGVVAGADVRQLEENLTALGFGAGLRVDDEFTSATAAAVQQWEADLGRGDPDGVVELGDIAFLALPGKVLSHEAGIGDPLGAGTPILVLGSRRQFVRAAVVVGEAASWAAGAEVALTWSDGSTTTGTVSGTGHDVTDAMVELVVAVGDADTTRPTGARVTVTAVDARRDGVVAVPVAAVVAGPGGQAAVRRTATAGSRADRLTPVTTGMISGGWVEIRSGVAAGDAVRLPG